MRLSDKRRHVRFHRKIWAARPQSAVPLAQSSCGISLRVCGTKKHCDAFNAIRFHCEREHWNITSSDDSYVLGVLELGCRDPESYVNSAVHTLTEEEETPVAQYHI